MLEVANLIAVVGELGRDDDLDAVTSCVVSPADIPANSIKKKPLKGFHQVAHQALHDALKNHGRKIGRSEHYPSKRQVVDASLWYNEFQLRRDANSPTLEAVRRSFDRARKVLQEEDYIREYENKVWFIDDPDGQDK